MSNNGDAMDYEIFIRRAYSCMRQQKYGADKRFIVHLLNHEDGKSLMSESDYNKSKALVNIHILKAFDKYLKEKLTPSDRELMLELRDSASKITDAKGMIRIINIADEVTIKFRND